ncbi:hypothetical protein EYC80_010044 [Monilinia laxa]|uniref:Uncharacterized protein n=1 Tax=Monilinia laxa TaxID=61186 RepID=A0A5N6JRF7_MONLA|nr:hypothetical protein EYC80_010044 [Monilinia laxa]
MILKPNTYIQVRLSYPILSYATLSQLPSYISAHLRSSFSAPFCASIHPSIPNFYPPHPNPSFQAPSSTRVPTRTSCSPPLPIPPNPHTLPIPIPTYTPQPSLYNQPIPILISQQKNSHLKQPTSQKLQAPPNGIRNK